MARSQSRAAPSSSLSEGRDEPRGLRGAQAGGRALGVTGRDGTPAQRGGGAGPVLQPGPPPAARSEGPRSVVFRSHGNRCSATRPARLLDITAGAGAGGHRAPRGDEGSPHGPQQHGAAEELLSTAVLCGAGRAAAEFCFGDKLEKHSSTLRHPV